MNIWHYLGIIILYWLLFPIVSDIYDHVRCERNPLTMSDILETLLWSTVIFAVGTLIAALAFGFRLTF